MMLVEPVALVVKRLPVIDVLLVVLVDGGAERPPRPVMLGVVVRVGAVV